MKKLLLLLSVIVINLTISFAQPTNYFVAPPSLGATTQLRAPNGTSTHAYQRAAELLLASELTAIAPSSTLTSFGFTLSAAASSSVAGTFTVYLQNTTDITYSKGTTWSSIISGMTTVYASTMTLPATGATSITVTLSTPFVYTGGGIYVAFDWFSAGPFATTPVTYFANNTLAGGCVSASSASAVPPTLGVTAFRPCLLLGTVNTYTNEIVVTGIEAQGMVATALGTSNIIKGIIKNGSSVTVNNIQVNLNVSGANTFANTQTISSLASGATTTVNLSSYSPTNIGLNNITISVLPDENNSNNSSVYTQSVTCKTWAINPAVATYTQGAVGFNTGSGIITSAYSNLNTSMIDGINYSISTLTANIGNSMWGVLLDATGTILATTNTITIANGNLGTKQALNFPTSQPLTAGTNYYLGVAQPSATVGYFPFGTYTSMAYVPFTNFGTTSLAGGAVTPLAVNLGYLNIEGVFKSNVLVSASNGTICEGQSFTLTPSGAITYTYSSGSAVVTPTALSTYTIIGADGNGCLSANTASVNVNVNTLPIISVNSGAICAGQSFTIVPSGATTYTYSGGNSVVNPTASTSYTVTGDNNGCINTAVSSVAVNALPIVSVNSGAICAGQSFTMTPSGATTYAFSNGSDIVTPTANSSYTLTGTDANGCSNTAVSSLTVNTLPIVSVLSATICSGATGTVVASGANTYTWNTGATTNSIVDNPSITTDYTVSGTSAEGCLGLAVTGAITVGAAPSIVVNSANICAGSSATLTANGVSTYTWNTGATSSSIIVTPTVNTVYSVNGDLVGCGVSASNAATVTINSLPIISVNSGTICSGQSFTMTPSGATTYTFSNGSDVVTSSVNSSYTVTGTDANGCENTAVSALSVNALPIISVNSGTICAGQSFTMVPTGAATYAYSNGSDVVTSSVNASYTVTGTDANGCENTAVSALSVNALPIISVNSGTICAGQSFTMTPSGAATYAYSNGSDVVTSSVNASYTVTGTDANGCANTAVSALSVNALPVVTAVTNNTLLCVGQTATLSVSGAATYTWSTTDNTATVAVSPTVQTTYTVNGTDANGCSNSTTVTQDVSLCTGIATLTNSKVAINLYPNPNNGLFTIELTSTSKVIVTNALGQIVIEATFEAGKHSLDIYNEATGVYFVKVIENNNQQIIKVVKQ